MECPDPLRLAESLEAHGVVGHPVCARRLTGLLPLVVVVGRHLVVGSGSESPAGDWDSSADEGGASSRRMPWDRAASHSPSRSNQAALPAKASNICSYHTAPAAFVKKTPAAINQSRLIHQSDLMYKWWRERSAGGAVTARLSSTGR